MKKVLFLMVATLLLTGCSKSDEYDISIDDIDDFYKSKRVYYDGTYYIPYVTNNYAYKFSENGNLIWKNKIQYPPVTIAESYGERVELEYHNNPLICLFRENYALYFAPSTPVTSPIFRYVYIDIYTNNGTLVKRTKYNMDMNLYSWNNDKILMIKDDNKKCWLSATGEEIDFQCEKELIFYTAYTPISSIGYVTYSSSEFMIVNFQKGNSYDILDNFIIKNFGIKHYKLEIIDVEVDNFNVLVHINITTKNNEKQDLILKINSETFFCEKV